MKRYTAILFAAAITMAIGGSAAADPHLEVGVAVAPTVVQDPGFEAFSQDRLRMDRFGADLRVEVLTFWKNVHLLPIVGYRFSVNEGRLYEMMDTRLASNDFFAGLRLRGWFQPWMGVFIQANGGLSWSRMSGELDEVSGVGARDKYEGDDLTWNAGGLLGMEFRLSPQFLSRRKIERFNFGGEISFGYIRKGDMEFSSEPKGGDEYSLPVEGSADWGQVNMSGWVVQLGLTFSFF